MGYRLNNSPNNSKRSLSGETGDLCICMVQRISDKCSVFQLTAIREPFIADVTKTGNGERGTGERGNGGTGERGNGGTGNRERESGNECTEVTRLRIESVGGNDVYKH